MRQRHFVCVGVLLVVCLTGTTAEAHDHGHGAGMTNTTEEEQPFLAENAAAMDKMMADMEVKPTGNIEVDFTAMMIPHHQGAIDMAVAYLRYGKNPQLQRLAQEIVVEQQQEIAAMRLALGQPLPPSASAPTRPALMPTDGASTSHHPSDHDATLALPDELPE